MIASVAKALAKADAWLDSMRGPSGYGGPIAHWWESNLLFTGALFDWRYEGIIDGYLELYRATRQSQFLDKAIRAAEDLLPQQLPDGRFQNSSFQFGPVAGGTPHEAAVDVALLRLAELLLGRGDKAGRRFLTLASENLNRYWIGCLWMGNGFKDQPDDPVLVANKHGTLLEALLAYQRLSAHDCTEYVDACVRAVLAARVEHGPQAGGTVHLGIGPSRLAIPIYTARAMNGLLSYWEVTHDDAVITPLLEASAFIVRHISPHGVMWGTYGSGRPCPNPHMTAGAGDALRFLWRMHAHGLADTRSHAEALTTTLFDRQQPSGGFPTAHGFAAKGLARTPASVDLRDVLPVVGWVDKTFRALALMLPSGSDVAAEHVEEYQTHVTFLGRRYRYREDVTSIELSDERGLPAYRWRKGTSAPTVYEFGGPPARRGNGGLRGTT